MDPCIYGNLGRQMLFIIGRESLDHSKSGMRIIDRTFKKYRSKNKFQIN